MASLLACAGLAVGALPGRQDAGDDRAELETQFARRMSGATLMGHFTVDGDPGGAAQPDSYHLGTVEKIDDEDRWSFESEIAYGDKRVELPIAVRVKWAGDTPVITLTDMAIPMLGTFTARVVVYRDRYAGIWMGADHGGQMYGRVIPAEGAEEPGAGASGEDDSE